MTLYSSVAKTNLNTDEHKELVRLVRIGKNGSDWKNHELMKTKNDKTAFTDVARCHTKYVEE